MEPKLLTHDRFVDRDTEIPSVHTAMFSAIQNTSDPTITIIMSCLSFLTELLFTV